MLHSVVIGIMPTMIWRYSVKRPKRIYHQIQSHSFTVDDLGV